MSWTIAALFVVLALFFGVIAYRRRHEEEARALAIVGVVICVFIALVIALVKLGKPETRQPVVARAQETISIRT